MTAHDAQSRDPGSGIATDRGPRSQPSTQTRRHRGTVAAAAVTVGAVALGVTGIAVARGATPYETLGVGVPPVGVQMAIPLARFLVVLSSGATLGGLVGALIARPSTNATRTLGAQGYRAVRWAGTAAGVWAVAALAGAACVVIGATGSDLRVLSRPEAFFAMAGALEEPGGYLVAAGLAATVAAMCGWTLSWRTAAAAVPLAALGVVSPVVTGQVASAGAGHDLATDAATLASIAVAVWFGLTALEIVVPDPGSMASRRIRRVALSAAATAIGSTIVVGAVLVRGQWLSAWHGRLVLAQLTLLVIAAGFACLHRRHVPVAGLLVAAAGTHALANVEQPAAIGQPATIQESFLGYTLLPPESVNLLGPGRPNLLWAAVAITSAVVYLAAARRLRRRGHRWPPGRTVAWTAGCALLAWTTGSELGARAMGMFSAHMSVHVVLANCVPILLALGGPISLALTALPADRVHDTEGPRAWISSVATSPIVRVLTHPAVSLALFAGAPYVLYFTALYPAAVPYHWGHQLMLTCVLLTGYLFFWPIIGADRAPHTIPHIGKLALLLVSMPVHTLFSLALIKNESVIGEQFFRQLDLPWVPDLLAEQALAGTVMWIGGETALLTAVIIVLVQWSPADRADADHDDERSAATAILAELARRR